MKILNLEIEGYRSLKSINWGPGNLNILIGPNGSGKSNLLRMLELISISAKGELGKYIQRAGGMDPLLWDGKAEVIFFSVRATLTEDKKNAVDGRLSYNLTIKRYGMGSTYFISYELFRKYDQVEKGKYDEPFVLIRRDGSNKMVFDGQKHNINEFKEKINQEESLLGQTAGPFMHDLSIASFRLYLAGWTVYHDLHVNMDSPIRQSVIARHETRVEPDGQNLINVLHTLYTGNRDFKNDINLAMRAAFGDDFDELVFAPAADQRIQLRVRWNSLSREQSAADLSDGTLRFLFLLTVLATPDPAPLIAIDEPETGLHPRMLPIIASFAADASERTQVIFTTHSPQFLDAFDDVVPTTTVFNLSDGETNVQNVKGEKLDRWLKEFSLGSLFCSGELESEFSEEEASPNKAGSQ